eukprot:TRINITY_DN15854_c0_g1_i1.p1 TRINITY_DN15854_c0_g1~~TRINITY_DN15854_c0_g1_i1.p1  ORF type:complete len:278 (+),score=88.47 TRINITY_DN15854_c0_g1_i1:90-923(+)
MSVDELVAKKIAGLSGGSQGLVEGLLGVFKTRKATHSKELEHELGRYQKTMLRDGMYSKQDVETLLSSFFTALQSTIQKELRSQTNVSTEFYAQLFSCASAKSLSLDPPRIPGSVAGSTPAFLQKSDPLKPANKLASLESATSGDAKINEQIKEVERENARQQEKVERITNQFQQMMQSKADVGAQLSSVRGEILEMKDKYGDAKPEEIAALQKQMSKIRSDNEAAKKALAAKLNDAPQFANFKKMISKKNDDLSKLRERLRNHELVYADDEDDPDF